MQKLAIIDIDGVLADSTARFAKAEEAKQHYIETTSNDLYQADMREATSVYWQTAFTPSLVWLDTLIDGTKQALEQIGNYAGYDYYFLTSRPESMREETMKWLFHHLAYDSDASLIMKPASQQFVKTVTWKSGVVELLVRLFGVEELCFVDDEQAHCDAIEALDLPCDMILCGSLQEAVISIGEAK